MSESERRVPARSSMFNLLGDASPPDVPRARRVTRIVLGAIEEPHTVEEIAAITGLRSEDVDLAIACLRSTKRVTVVERRRNTSRRGRVLVNVYRVRVR